MTDPRDRDTYRRAGWMERAAATALGLVVGAVMRAAMLVRRWTR